MQISSQVKKEARDAFSDNELMGGGWYISGGGKPYKRKKFLLERYNGDKENFKPSYLIIQN